MSIIDLRSKYAHAGIHIFLVVDKSNEPEPKSEDTEEIAAEKATEESHDKQKTQPGDKDAKEGEEVGKEAEEKEANADTKDTDKSETGV